MAYILAKFLNYAIITFVKKRLSFIDYLKMFLTFLKLGFLSIGGGNTMVSMLEGELIDKKKWLTIEELTEMLAVAEVTPGPIAINIATYIGYKRGKIFGALCTTLGIVIPPVICMFIIATFLDKLTAFAFINYVLAGIKCGVIILLISVSVSLIKKTKVDLFGILAIIVVVLSKIILTIFGLEFSAVYYIIAGALLGILIYGIIPKRKMRKTLK